MNLTLVYAVALPYGGRLWRVAETHATQADAEQAAQLYAVRLGRQRSAQPVSEVRIYAVAEGTLPGALVSGEPVKPDGLG